MIAPEDKVAFCEAEHPRLVRSLTLYTGDHDLAAELAQEALARACLHWDRVARMDSPGAWLHRVALNIANSHFRRRSAERRALRRHGAAPESGPPEDLAHALELREAVRALPRRQRGAVTLRYFADFSVAQTAYCMKCAPGTVQALTHQAIANLRTTLAASEPAAVPRGDGQWT